MTAYFPIDPRMKSVDVINANHAYPNETNDGWLFAHCDKDYMIDHEYKVLSGISAAFEEELEDRETDIYSAIQDVLTTNTPENRTILTGYRRTHEPLLRFIKDVKTAALVEMRSKHIGYYHQNPHESHIHLIIERAIETTIPKWSVASRLVLEYGPIKAYVDRVLAFVKAKHAYETRWVKEARLAAEAKAKEAEQE